MLEHTAFPANVEKIHRMNEFADNSSSDAIIIDPENELIAERGLKGSLMRYRLMNLFSKEVYYEKISTNTLDRSTISKNGEVFVFSEVTQNSESQITIYNRRTQKISVIEGLRDLEWFNISNDGENLLVRYLEKSFFVYSTEKSKKIYEYEHMPKNGELPYRVGVSPDGMKAAMVLKGENELELQIVDIASGGVKTIRKYSLDTYNSLFALTEDM